MITKTEELSIVIDKILEQRQTGKKVQRQQILRAIKEAELVFLITPWSVEVLEVE